MNITEVEFTTAVTHTRNIIRALELEEKFDVLVGNYEEFEAELLRLTVEKAIHRQSSWHDDARDCRLVNRRVNNLLSSCRMYLDHLRHGICSIYGSNSPQLAQVDQATDEEYNRSFSYRLIEQLRNYTQHRRLPIDAWTTSYKPTAYGADKQVACTLTPQVTKSYVLDERR